MQEKAFLALYYGVDEFLMGGMAGPGKTWTNLAIDVPDLLKTPEMRVLQLRRHSVDMGALIEGAYKMYAPLGAKFSGMDRIYKHPVFVFPCGSMVIFAHCNLETDKFAFQGWEIPRIRVDEGGHFTRSQYLYVMSRNRNSYGLRNQMSASCNPQGPGMLWLKDRFVDRLLPGEIGWFSSDPETGRDQRVSMGTPLSMSRMWIPGKRSENKLGDPNYEAKLAQMSAEDQRALRFGSWEITPGPKQLIRPEWITRAMSGSVKPLSGFLGGCNAIGADYGAQGNDYSVICCGTGNRVTSMVDEKKSRTGAFAARLSTMVAVIGLNNTTLGVDGNGWGNGVCDELEDRYGLGAQLNRMMYKDPHYKPKRLGDWKFDCLRSQVWWRLAEDLEAGNVDLSWLGSSKCDYDGVQLLLEELFAIEYDSSSGYLRIISKNELAKANKLGRSPDRADTIAYWNWVRKRVMPSSGSGNIDEGGYDYRKKVEEPYAGMGWL